MGFTITALAQKARTATLIADSDLNLGNYDLIATDVRGDTAEFDEFVGGVGNFSNVLGSGNLDIEGTGNIKGLTTFQNAVQVNGALHVEGSINNVNIADNGEITTAQGVNGADFNGAPISANKFNGATITATKFNGATIDSTGNITGVKGTFSGAVTGATFNGVPIKSSGVLTVNPTSNFNIQLPVSAYTPVTVLPPNNCTYTGSLKIKRSSADSCRFSYSDGTQTGTNPASIEVAAGATYTLQFTNIKYLVMHANAYTDVYMTSFTLS